MNMAKYSDIRNIRVLAFLEAYERQECLWNPLLDSYKNKADRDGAYLEIIKELNIPSLTVHDVKLKVKGIRTTYTKELRLLTKHREQGKKYKPKLFWFSKANAFLRNVCVSRHKKSFYLKEEDTSNQTEFKDCTIEYISDDGSGDDIAENENEHENETNDSHDMIQSTPTHAFTETPIDFKTFVHVVDQIDNQVDGAQEKDTPEPNYLRSSCLDIPETCGKTEVEPPANSVLKDDEFELFCRSVAAQLRSIPDSYSRSVAKLKIQQILFEAETGHYKNSPCITIPIVQQINSL